MVLRDGTVMEGVWFEDRLDGWVPPAATATTSQQQPLREQFQVKQAQIEHKEVKAMQDAVLQPTGIPSVDTSALQHDPLDKAFDASNKPMQHDPLDKAFDASNKPMQHDPLDKAFDASNKPMQHDPLDKAFDASNKPMQHDPLDKAFDASNKPMQHDPLDKAFDASNKPMQHDPLDKAFDASNKPMQHDPLDKAFDASNKPMQHDPLDKAFEASNKSLAVVPGGASDAFDLVDVNHDGVIDRQELDVAIQAGVVTVSSSEQMAQTVDRRVARKVEQAVEQVVQAQLTVDKADLQLEVHAWQAARGSRECMRLAAASSRSGADAALGAALGALAPAEDTNSQTAAQHGSAAARSTYGSKLIQSPDEQPDHRLLYTASTSAILSPAAESAILGPPAAIGRPLKNAAVEARIAAKKRWAQGQARRRQAAEVYSPYLRSTSPSPPDARSPSQLSAQPQEPSVRRQLPQRSALPARGGSTSTVKSAAQGDVPTLPLSQLLPNNGSLSAVGSLTAAESVGSESARSDYSESSLSSIPISASHSSPARPSGVSPLPLAQLENPVDGLPTPRTDRSLQTPRRSGRGSKHTPGQSLLSKAWGLASPETVATVVTGVAVVGVAFLSYRSLTKGHKPK